LSHKPRDEGMGPSEPHADSLMEEVGDRPRARPPAFSGVPPLLPPAGPSTPPVAGLAPVVPGEHSPPPAFPVPDDRGNQHSTLRVGGGRSGVDRGSPSARTPSLDSGAE